MDLPYDQLLFMAAEGLTDGDERRAFLDGACRDDPELRKRIDRLFEVQDEAVAYLDTKPAPERRQAADQQDRLDTKVGRYRLVERLGEGGYGIVYLAEQCEPVRRKVALKIVRPGMDTERMVARFESERQALAMMDHPNIARVLDAGATSSGRPFYVMELVDGEGISAFCDDHHLGLRQRLEIFVQVCGAIHHAHQKGVIHRDIKPSNILVRMQDGVAVPKVIDFGIAKMAHREPGAIPLTSTDQFLGTPAYMSPEVAAGSLDLDTRCDIHSLGGVLFELLTGEAPIRAGRLEKLGIEEIRAIFRDEEPRVPSVVLAGLGADELAAVAAARGCDGARLLQQVRGDLDWIVAKAMDRERERRYASAHGLALDVRRHLDCEAVGAGPPDRFYRLAKLVRRNKVPFVSGAVALVALVAGFGTSTVLFLREKQARADQERLRARAEMARSAEQEMRRQAEYRERISHAAVLVSHGELEAADELLRSVPFGQVPPSLEAAEAYLKVGEWHVLAEHWREASGCFANLAIVLPSIDTADSFDISVVVIRAAALLCHTGETDRYEVIRRQSIDRFSGTSSPVVAEQVFKAALLTPPDGETLAELGLLGGFLEKCLVSGHPELDGNDFRTSWCCFALALMRYREGDFESASRWADRALPIAGDHVPRETMLRCLRAMLAWQRGDEAAARSLLAEARGPLDRYRSRPIQLGDATSSWSDWLVVRLLEQEARALVGD